MHSRNTHSSRFQKPFIKPMTVDTENKENVSGLNINKLVPLDKKESFFCENRKFSLNPNLSNDLLSPGHFTQKTTSFKSPQRKIPSYYNIKGGGSPALTSKIASNNNLHIPQIIQKENILDRVKAMTSDLVFNTKTFINNKFNQISSREKCACEAGLSREETCKLAFSWLFKRYKKKDLEYLKNTYNNLLKSPIVEDVVINQISKDILRTYPNCSFYKEGHEGSKSLERILITFASYDPQMGYVQGMNYIAAFFLYHAEEYVAFWLIVVLFELFELRDVYLPSNR